MTKKIIKMDKIKRIALIAHDNRKIDLLEWAKYNKQLLAEHELFGTGTTGQLISNELNLPVHKFKSGPIRRRSAGWGKNFRRGN
jgi:methylglyoxal synthase